MMNLHDVRVEAGGRTILGPIDLTIEPGSFVAIIGPNGAGKSTLVKTLSGEIRPASGTVRLDGHSIDRLTPEVLASRRAVLSQATQLAFPFTVLEVVRLGLQGRRALTEENRTAAAHRALQKVDLDGFAGREFNSLSGGEQQRVHLARVLCQIGEPTGDGMAKMLILDEPISSLDIRHQVEVLAIAQCYSENGGAVVAVLHDINLAASFCDRLMLMNRGSIVDDGRPEQILKSGRFQEVFVTPVTVIPHPTDGFPIIQPDLATLRNRRLTTSIAEKVMPAVSLDHEETKRFQMRLPS